MWRSVLRIVFFLGLLNLTFTKVTAADMSTTKTVAQNEWSVTTLAISSRDTASDQGTNVLFNISALKPGGYQVRSVRIQNDGAMNTAYNLSAEVTGGDKALCDNLDIKILKDWQVKYDGNLINLELNGQVANSSSEDWVMVVGLNNKDKNLIDKTCSFNLWFKTNTNGLSDKKKVESTVSSGTWQ